VLNNTS